MPKPVDAEKLAIFEQSVEALKQLLGKTKRRNSLMDTRNELKHGKHLSSLFYLDKDHLSDVSEKMSEESYALKTIEGLKRTLEHDLSKAIHCSTCGGLVPEINFIWRGREYWFTCYKIVDFDKHEIVAETDYAKFGEYCQDIVKGVV